MIITLRKIKQIKYFILFVSLWFHGSFCFRHPGIKIVPLHHVKGPLIVQKIIYIPISFTHFHDRLVNLKLVWRFLKKKKKKSCLCYLFLSASRQRWLLLPRLGPRGSTRETTSKSFSVAMVTGRAHHLPPSCQNGALTTTTGTWTTTATRLARSRAPAPLGRRPASGRKRR